jgi:hypothetical protein
MDDTIKREVLGNLMISGDVIYARRYLVGCKKKASWEFVFGAWALSVHWIVIWYMSGMTVWTYAVFGCGTEVLLLFV